MHDDKPDQFVDELLGRGRGGSRTAPTNDQGDQFVDQLLEAALKQYRGEEPRPGLETRVLAGIRSRERTVRLRWLALAACVGMLAAIVLALHFARAPSLQPVPSASLPRPTAKPLAGSGVAGPRLWGPRRVQEPKQKPRPPKPGIHAAGPARPEQFPTPVPLTEQEKLLLAYLDKAIKTGSVAETNQTDEALNRDLEIPGIKIAALEIKPLDDSQSEQEK